MNANEENTTQNKTIQYKATNVSNRIVFMLYMVEHQNFSIESLYVWMQWYECEWEWEWNGRKEKKTGDWNCMIVLTIVDSVCGYCLPQDANKTVNICFSIPCWKEEAKLNREKGQRLCYRFLMIRMCFKWFLSSRVLGSWCVFFSIVYSLMAIISLIFVELFK